MVQSDPRNTPAHPMAAHGLERHFATYVSMTPPASFGSRTSNETPFAWSGQQAAPPATEFRQATNNRGTIPRSRAFGHLAPLTQIKDLETDSTDEDESSHQDTDPAVLGESSSSGIRRTFGLHSLTNHGLGISASDEHGQWPGSTLSDGTDGDVLGSRTRSRRQSVVEGLDAPSIAKRRGKMPAFLNSRSSDALADEMDVDSDTDADVPPPPSPSPMGDGSLSAELSRGSLHQEQPFGALQPGLVARSTRRAGGTRSISAGGTDPNAGLIDAQAGLPLASFATPDRVSVRAQSRGRALSSASAQRPLVEFLTPRSTSSSAITDERLAGSATLFGFASQPRPVTRPIQNDTTPETTRESKRRSTGSSLVSFSAGKLFENEIAAARSGTSHSKSQTFNGQDDSPALCTPAPSRISRRVTPGSSHFGDMSRSLSDTGPDSPAYHFGADDSGVAFGDDDGKSSHLGHKDAPPLASQLGLRKAAVASMSHMALGHSRKSFSADSLSSPSKAASITSTPPRREVSFNGNTPASRPPIALHNPFGPKERSALANETRWSDASSAASSPERSRKAFASPARKPSGMQGLNASEGSSYLTPQNFKSVKPLQAAFMSTGLVSKRTRTRGGSFDAGSNGNSTSISSTSDELPVPPRPNFGSALGLREVVAAATAHAVAHPEKGHAMPDTPVKKGTPAMMPFPVAAGPPSSLRPPSQASRRAPSPLGMYSPAQDSVSSGGSIESPLLPGGCDSPTLNLMSLSPPSARDACHATNAHGWPAFSTLPRSRRSPMSIAQAFQPFASGDADEDDAVAPASPSIQPSQSPPQTTLRRGKLRSRMSAQALGRKAAPPSLPTSDSMRMRSASQADVQVHTPVSTAAAALNKTEAKIGHKRGQLSEVDHTSRQRPPYPRNRGSIGLQRKNSSANVVDSGGRPLPVPMTPTRNAAQIKWFEGELALCARCLPSIIVPKLIPHSHPSLPGCQPFLQLPKWSPLHLHLQGDRQHSNFEHSAVSCCSPNARHSFPTYLTFTTHL